MTDHLSVGQHRAHVESYARQPDGAWLLREAGPGGEVTLRSIGVTLAVDAVYRGVFELPA